MKKTAQKLNGLFTAFDYEKNYFANVTAQMKQCCSIFGYYLKANYNLIV